MEKDQIIVTVIMPIRNEVNFIDKSIKAILNQTFDSNQIEIIIVDGMSTDGTYNKIVKYEKNNKNIKIIQNIEKIVSTGFNRALSLARGEIVIRVDGHCIVDKYYIENAIKVIKEKNCVCVGGSIENISSGMIANSINIAQSSKFGVGGVSFREQNKVGKYVDTLAFGAYKKYIFEKIGGYDQELVRNQDDEFNFRLIQSGEKIWLDPSIKSKYYCRNSYYKLFLQYFSYGLFKVRVIQKRRSFASFRHLIPSIFVLSFFSSLIMSVYELFYIPFISITAVYVFSSFLFSMLEIFKFQTYLSIFHLILSPFLIMISYLILHFSYGLGFLYGLVKFSLKWRKNNIVDSLYIKKIRT